MTRSVLLVDDEERLLRALRHVLRKEDYCVHTAGSAAEALRILSSETIDVLISDECMPGLSGSDLLVRIRKEQPQVILILLTGEARSEQIVRAINQADIYRFLQKPCSGLDLLITVRRALQHKDLVETAALVTALARRQVQILDHLAKENRKLVDDVRRSLATKPLDANRGDCRDLIVEMHTLLEESGPMCSQGDWRPTYGESTSDTDAPVASPQTNALEPPADAPSAANPPTPLAATSTPDSCQAGSLKDLKPLMSRSEIQELLDHCNELKAMSPTVTQLLKLTQSSRCSMDQLVRVVKQDHAISLKLLKLANSSAYTRGEPVDTVQKAVMRIGTSQIRQAVLNIHVIESFASDACCGWLNSPLFWEHAIATGLICAELVRNLGETESAADTAFTMGLLHDVGRMIYFGALGDQYECVLRAAESLQLPLEQVESRMLLVNHADAMDRVLHKWRFAKELINPIALHQLSLGNIRRLAPRSLTEVAILALANRLAHALLLGTSGNLSLYATEDFIDVLGVKENNLRSIENDIPSQTNDMKFTLLASTGATAWPCLRDQLRERIDRPFRPLHMSMNPACDATRIFCDRMRDDASDAGPNIAIVHMRRGQERVPVTTRLLQAEADAGVENLPAIILSPKADIALEDRFMAARPHTLLPIPLHLCRLVDAAKSLLE